VGGRLYRALLLDSPNDLALAINWYEELAANSSDPEIVVQLAILEGESGRIEQLHKRVADWELGEEPYLKFAQLIRVAYLNSSKTAREVDIKLIPEIAPGWFHERLTARLFTDSSDHARRARLSEITSRSARMLVLVRFFVAMTLIITIGGSLALFLLLFRSDSPALSIGTASIPPCWSGAAGTAVLIRSSAIFILMATGAVLLEGRLGFSVPIIWLCVSLLGILAFLGLARRYLFKSADLEIKQAFGLSISEAKRGQLLLWVFLLLTAAWLGEWGILWISEWLRLPIHWTESFDADFVWGDPSTVGMTGMHAVVLGPIFEELLFRGVLFATLRIRFNLGSAAILSGLIFSLVHGYSIAGFLSVAWTGVLWAWAYEKTRSLLPGVIAHGVHNFLWSSALIAFLRG
jgi:membrane protease YdiL (CAAX protease family)